MASKLEYVNGGLHVTFGTDNGSQTRESKDQVPQKSAPKQTPPSTQNQKDSKSQNKSEAKYREREYVAEGNAIVIADPDIQANKTITLAGIGQVMSGNWYVETVIHTWSRAGYNMELELRSNAAGGMKPSPSPPRKPPAQPKEAPKKTYTVKRGDTLWAIASKYYGSGTQWRKIWEANKSMLIARDKRNQKTPGHWIYPGQVLTIP